MNWRRILRRRWWDNERAREIECYLDIETEENTARGMTRADAAGVARRKFGNPLLVREEIYGMNTIGWLDSLWQDLRYGARLLRLSPGFALVAVASLALGIGANAGIFQLLDAVRLRSLPVRNPQELVEVRIVGGNKGFGVNNGRYSQLTRPVWQEISEHHEPFAGVFAWGSEGLKVGPLNDLRRANGLEVSGGFFRVLGVEAWRGRLLLPEDETACPGSKAVVSYAYWQGQMGGRDVIRGATLMVNGEIKEVVGVTPPGFFGLAVGESFDIALPFCMPKELRRDLFDIAVMGRLAPGWNSERASSQLESISPGVFEATVPGVYSSESLKRYKEFRLRAYPASNGVSWLRHDYDTSLWLLFAITGLVLLIACANLANLMLARASTRERELAVRLALGASRWRLTRQMLAESILLAAIGATAGIGLAQVLSRALIRSISTGPSTIELPIEMDWRVLLFGATAAALTCIVFGVVPAIRASKTDPQGAMKASGRSSTASREKFSAQRLMLVTQIAISFVLLVGALLFVRSFRNLMSLDPGMRRDGIVVAYIGFERST